MSSLGYGLHEVSLSMVMSGHSIVVRHQPFANYAGSHQALVVYRQQLALGQQPLGVGLELFPIGSTSC